MVKISMAAPKHIPMIGPNNNPPILISTPSIKILVPAHSLKTRDAALAVTKIKNKIIAMLNAKIIPILEIPWELTLGIIKKRFLRCQR